MIALATRWCVHCPSLAVLGDCGVLWRPALARACPQPGAEGSASLIVQRQCPQKESDSSIQGIGHQGYLVRLALETLHLESDCEDMTLVYQLACALCR